MRGYEGQHAAWSDEVFDEVARKMDGAEDISI